MHPEENLETENDDYSRPASENDIPLETVTGEPEEVNEIDYDEPAETPEIEAIKRFWMKNLFSSPTQLFSN